jgi:hypothetical protein
LKILVENQNSVAARLATLATSKAELTYNLAVITEQLTKYNAAVDDQLKSMLKRMIATNAELTK